jgi:predicted kinase
MPKRDLVIMRGVSGTGKTTRARELLKHCALAGNEGVILSSDDYFGETPEEYAANFSPLKLADAHRQNQNSCRHYMDRGVTPIIIDNTNTEAWEIKPYVLMANECGYDVHFVEPDTQANRQVNSLSHDIHQLAKRLQARQVHNVPLSVIKQMIARFQNINNLEEVESSPAPTFYTTEEKCYSRKLFIEHWATMILCLMDDSPTDVDRAHARGFVVSIMDSAIGHAKRLDMGHSPDFQFPIQR